MKVLAVILSVLFVAVCAQNSKAGTRASTNTTTAAATRAPTTATTTTTEAPKKPAARAPATAATTTTERATRATRAPTTAAATTTTEKATRATRAPATAAPTTAASRAPTTTAAKTTVAPRRSSISRKRGQYGPKGVIIDFTVANCYEGRISYVADKGNLCWYWQCVQQKTGRYDLIPRRCALGSKMPYEYRSGQSNPCLANFNADTNFDCTRADDDIVFNQEPDCFSTQKCFNGGNATYEGSICWCNCPKEWTGAADCSKKTGKTVESATGGEDEENCYHDEPPCDRVNGCENGGTCHNQCKDFWCDCPVPFTNGKRCEAFDCVTNSCQNGGTCNRGQDDKDEVNNCICPSGYTGLLCEIPL